MQASIIHTVDGGNTWTRLTGVPSGTSLSYQSIFFEASGTLRWSVNAGETASLSLRLVGAALNLTRLTVLCGQRWCSGRARGN
jgi:hypothetical protein